MDVVEYLEQITHVELVEWQKHAIRDLYELYKDNDEKLYVIMRPFNGRSAFYTYLKKNNLPISKELTQYGTTPKNY